jgi:two-component system sensor histidine kinase UhpB
LVQRICVAYDDDDGRSDAALALAAGWARLCGARLTLVHVADPPLDEPLNRAQALASELLGATEDHRWRARLRGIAARDVPVDVPVDVLVAVGAADEQLPALAAASGADVVVAGAPTGTRTRWHRSDVVRALLDRSGLPVVLVPGPPSRRIPRPSPPSWTLMNAQPSLLARIFAVNALVLVAATLLLIVTPLTISRSIVLNEVIVVAAGLAVMLVADYALLRHTLAPLRTITDLMGTIDARHPGRRLPAEASHGAEVAALAKAFNAMLERLERERRESARRALAAQEDERARVARELHDELGQTLTAITIQAERAASVAVPGDPAALEAIARTALVGVEDVRRLARELRPEALDDLGLANALIGLCTRMEAQSAIRIDRRLDTRLPPLSPEVELVIYRIAQESITNAVRHAAPTRISVELAATTEGVHLVVRDDGIGIDAEVVERDTSAGLSGMHERALFVNGTLEIRGGEDGTEVRLWIPVEDA